MRSAYFPINRTLHRGERETAGERERKRKRQRCEMVKTHKWYYLHHMTSAYFAINRTLQRDNEIGIM